MSGDKCLFGISGMIVEEVVIAESRLAVVVVTMELAAEAIVAVVGTATETDTEAIVAAVMAAIGAAVTQVV
jgi:hypothetical protein